MDFKGKNIEKAALQPAKSNPSRQNKVAQFFRKAFFATALALAVSSPMKSNGQSGANPDSAQNICTIRIKYELSGNSKLANVYSRHFERFTDSAVSSILLSGSNLADTAAIMSSIDKIRSSKFNFVASDTSALWSSWGKGVVNCERASFIDFASLSKLGYKPEIVASGSQTSFAVGTYSSGWGHTLIKVGNWYLETKNGVCMPKKEFESIYGKPYLASSDQFKLQYMTYLAIGNRHYAISVGGGRLSNISSKRAIRCYKRAIELEPAVPFAHYNLSVILEKQGDLKGAISSLKKVVAIDPNFMDDQARWRLYMLESALR
jgi:hypothetical protein